MPIDCAPRTTSDDDLGGFEGGRPTVLERASPPTTNVGDRFEFHTATGEDRSPPAPMADTALFHRAVHPLGTPSLGTFASVNTMTCGSMSVAVWRHRSAIGFFGAMACFRFHVAKRIVTTLSHPPVTGAVVEEEGTGESASLVGEIKTGQAK